MTGTGGPAGGAWQPGAYLRFAGERARPFADLLARVGAGAPRSVVDLGCGEGSLTATLAQRWPGARVTGVDSSPEMLAAARAAAPGQVEYRLGDVRDWAPSGPVDVVVSNAVLHWVPGHPGLMGRWAAALPPGGWLAVQVPGNFRAPTHVLLADLCRSREWAGRTADAAPRTDTALDGRAAGARRERASGGGSVVLLLHVLRGPDPVLGWVRSTVLRPVLARLDDDAAAAFTAAYAAALRTAYPPRPDGTTLLPFRRVFAVGTRPPE